MTVFPAINGLESRLCSATTALNGRRGCAQPTPDVFPCKKAPCGLPIGVSYKPADAGKYKAFEMSLGCFAS